MEQAREKPVLFSLVKATLFPGGRKKDHAGPGHHILRAGGGDTRAALVEHVLLHIHCILKKRENHNSKFLLSLEYKTLIVS